MTPKEAAEIFAEEMVADLRQWVDLAIQWTNRYTQYGKQFNDDLEPSRRESIKSEVADILRKFKKAADEI